MRLPEQIARARFASPRGPCGWPRWTKRGVRIWSSVTFAVDGDRIYSAVDAKPKRTRDLKRLRNIQADPRVAVLADHYEDEWSRLWWVRADATAEIVENPAAMAEPIALLRERYRQYRAHPPEGPVIVMAVHRWTGWSAS